MTKMRKYIRLSTFFLFWLAGSRVSATPPEDWFPESVDLAFTNVNNLCKISAVLTPGLKRKSYLCITFTGLQWINLLSEDAQSNAVNALKDRLLSKDNWIPVETHGAATWAIVNLDHVLQYQPCYDSHGKVNGYTLSLLGVGAFGYGKFNVTDPDDLRKLEHYLSIPPP